MDAALLMVEAFGMPNTGRIADQAVGGYAWGLNCSKARVAAFLLAVASWLNRQ